MNLAWAAALACQFVGQAASPRAPLPNQAVVATALAPGGPKIQRLFVPEEKLGEFLPKDEITYFRTVEEFDRLIERYRQRFGAATPREPVECALEATLDPKEMRLVGTGRWRAPAGDAPFLRLGPWSPFLLSIVREGLRREPFGMSAAGDLLLEAAPGTPAEVTIEWQLPASIRQDKWSFDLRLPNCALASLRLKAPPDWTLRTLAKTIRPADPKEAVEIHFGGTPGVILDLIPPAAHVDRRAVRTWQGDQIYRFEESGTELKAEFRFEAIHEPVESIRLLVDERIHPQELRTSTPARWRRAHGPPGMAIWTAEFRRPPLGPFRVDLKATLPAAVGLDWRPPLLLPDDALARGQTITFSIPRTLRVQGFAGGAYVPAMAGTVEDGRYQLVFQGLGEPGGAPSIATLSPADVLDWAGFSETIKQEAAAAGPSVGRRIVELAGEPFLADVRQVAETPDERAQSRILDALNRLLEREDLFPPGKDEPVEPPEGVRRNRRLLEEAFPRDLARLRTKQGLPEIRLAVGQPDVEVVPQNFLELRRDRVRLAARIRWRCQEGTLFQPSVLLPPQWTVTQVEANPAQRLVQYRTEPHEVDGTILLLELDRGLTEKQSFEATIFAEAQEGTHAGARERTEFPLPEIRPLEFPATGPATYAIFLDPGLPCSKESLPASRPGAVEYPWPRRPAAVEEYSFQYSMPLENIALSLLAEQPRVSVEHDQLVRWGDGEFRAEAAVVLHVEQGLARSLVFSTTRPLPESTRWVVDGGQNAIVSFRPIESGPVGSTPAAASARLRYRVDLAAPVDRTVRLLATWSIPAAEFDVPLFEFPEADRFRARIDVVAPAGRNLEIEAASLGDADAAGADVKTPPAGLVWSTSYLRLPENGSLRVKAPSETARVDAEAPRHAVLLVQTIDKGDWLFHRMLAMLDTTSVEPLVLRMQKDARLWSIALDGEPVAPIERDGAILVSEQLAPGSHALDLIVAAPKRRWMGLGRVGFVPPLGDWTISAFLWEVHGRRGESPLAGSNLERLMESDADGPGDVPFPASLQAAFERLKPSDLEDLAGAMVALGRGMPEGTRLLVDQRALPPPELAAGAPPASAAEWLGRYGLTAREVDSVVFVVGQAPAMRFGADLSNPAERELLNRALHAAESTGADAWERLVLPGELLLRASTPIAPGRFDWRVAESEPTHWTVFRARDVKDLGSPSILLFPKRISARVARLAALVVACGLWWAASRWGIRAQRRFLAGVLLLLLLAELVGGWAADLFGPLGWSSSAVLAALLLAPAMGWVVPPARAARGAAVAMVVLTQGLVLGQQAAPRDEIFRVLIPYRPDEAAPSRTSRVSIPQRLLRLLESAPASEDSGVLVRSALWEGRQDGPDRVRWTVRLALEADPRAELPVSCSLPLDGCAPTSVWMEESRVDFRPPGKDATLDFKLTRHGPVAVRIEFTTPILGAAGGRELEFATPLAPSNELRLELDRRASRLLEETGPAGLAIDPTGNGTRIVGRFGPTARLRVRWREAAAGSEGPSKAAPPRRATVASLLDVAPTTQDVFTAVRLEGGGDLEEMRFQIHPSLAIRRVDAPRLAGWRIEPDPAPTDSAGAARDGAQAANGDSAILKVDFDPPSAEPVTILIHAFARLTRPREARVAPISPLGVASETGSFAVRIPAEWSVEKAPLVGGASAPVEDFLAAWRRLEQPTPDRIASAWRYENRDLEGSIRFRSSPPQWRVEQRTSVAPNPFSRAAQLGVEAQIRPGETPLQVVQFRAPAGVEIERVTAAGLFQWFASGPVVTLLPDRPINAPWDVRISCRTRGSAAGGGREPVRFDLAALRWLGAKETSSAWNVDVPAAWRLRVVDRRAVTFSEIEGNTLSAMSPSNVHGFRIELAPVQPELEVRAATVVTLRGEEAVVDGRFSLFLTQGSPARFEFKSSDPEDDVVWESADLRAAGSRVVGDDRIWTLEPSRALSGRFTVDWRLRRRVVEGQRLIVPKVELVGYPAREYYVVADPRSEPALTEVEVRGLERTNASFDVGLWPSTSPAPTVLPVATAYRATNPDWSLALRGGDPPERPEDLIVRRMDAEVYLAPGGDVRGAARWEVLVQTADAVSIELPAGARAEAVLLDLQPISLSAGSEAVRVPLVRRPTWQTVTLYWSDHSVREGGRRIGLPSLPSSAPFESLVRVRGPAGWQAFAEATSLDRGGWIGRRYVRALDRLADRLKEWESRPGPLQEERVLDLLSRIRAIDAQLDDARRSSTDPSLVVERDRLRGQRAELVRRYQAEPLERRAQDRLPAAPELVPTLWAAPADTATHFLADEPIRWIGLERRAEALSSSWRADRVISAASLLAALAALFLPGLWPMLAAYWPAFLLPLAIAWLRWSESPLAGAGLAILVVAGTTAMVARWFDAVPAASESTT